MLQAKIAAYRQNSVKSLNICLVPGNRLPWPVDQGALELHAGAALGEHLQWPVNAQAWN